MTGNEKSEGTKEIEARDGKTEALSREIQILSVRLGWVRLLLAPNGSASCPFV
jgi:hypothetical protein